MRQGAVLGIALAALLASMATARSPAPVNDAAVQEGMPRTLSEYGFFADLRAQTATYGVEDYSLNTPLWSDGAEKLRFVYVPKGTQLAAGGDGLLQFPVGSAIIKTFAFGEGPDRRLIETRVLLHRADGWLALPYRWNAGQTDAALALAGGRVDLTTPAGEAISYRIPNKNQCKDCHSKDGVVIPLGPKARNLSRDWLEGMVAAGHLDAVPSGADSLPRWTGRSSAAEIAPYARAYLDVNCAHCHQPGGGASNSGLDLRWEQHEPVALGVMKRPVAAGRGAGGHLFDVLPGQPDKSILVYRMESREPGVVMPEIGTSTIDRDGTAVVRQWIAEMEAQ